ncbi:hypothetical protein B0H13DRAFT_2267689 [Mycena leptocephala]|nr:hypothetical protein B0H13DRAFT_2267689 [Mycena leptocephala]
MFYGSGNSRKTENQETAETLVGAPQHHPDERERVQYDFTTLCPFFRTEDVRVVAHPWNKSFGRIFDAFCTFTPSTASSSRFHLLDVRNSRRTVPMKTLQLSLFTMLSEHWDVFPIAQQHALEDLDAATMLPEAEAMTVLSESACPSTRSMDLVIKGRLFSLSHSDLNLHWMRTQGPETLVARRHRQSAVFINPHYVLNQLEASQLNPTSHARKEVFLDTSTAARSFKPFPPQLNRTQPPKLPALYLGGVLQYVSAEWADKVGEDIARVGSGSSRDSFGDLRQCDSTMYQLGNHGTRRAKISQRGVQGWR